jgi:hypothetical protein
MRFDLLLIAATFASALATPERAVATELSDICAPQRANPFVFRWGHPWIDGAAAGRMEIVPVGANSLTAAPGGSVVCASACSASAGSVSIACDDAAGCAPLNSTAAENEASGCGNCHQSGFGSNLGGCASGDACGKSRLLGFIAPSDNRFSDFVSPMTNPVYFEDPRNLTEARVIFLNHQIPGAVAGGGTAQLLATQFRVALNKRLSIIATKDGYIFNDSRPGINGWANVNAGLKYNIYANPDLQRLLSAAVIYELPVGSTHALQGNGDGVFDLTLTGGTQVGRLSHFVTAGGFRLPTDPNQQNDIFWWSTHIDRRLKNRPLYGFFETNLYHYLSNANGGIPGVGGLDLFNLGSPGVAGTTIVTGALGAKYRFGEMNELGVAFEAPLTAKQDILNNRIQVDLILRY